VDWLSALKEKRSAKGTDLGTGLEVLGGMTVGAEEFGGEMGPPN